MTPEEIQALRSELDELTELPDGRRSDFMLAIMLDRRLTRAMAIARQLLAVADELIAKSDSKVSATTTTQVESLKPRVWNHGDPEPGLTGDIRDAMGSKVRDREGDIWVRSIGAGGSLWSCAAQERRHAHGPWGVILEMYGPLVEEL